MESWLKDLVETVDGIIWSQWASLGAFVSVDPCTKSLVDPEALLVATCAFGREDARIFDEALDWTLLNHALLKPWRLKKISRPYGPDVQRTLGATLDFAAKATGRNIFPGVREEARRVLAEVETEELFRREKGLYAPGRKHPDPVFLEWKLLRGSPRIRGHSGAPDLKNPANLLLRLRELYGAEARADVMTYLLLEKGGSSNGIAAKVKYQQGRVYDVLERLVEAGIAHKQGGRGQAYYWIDQEKVAASLGLGRKRPTFFVWSEIFLAFHFVVSDWRKHRDDYRDDFLASERMRDLTALVVPLLVKAGEPLSRLPVPNARRLKGTEYKEALAAFLTRVGRVLKRFTMG